MRARLGAEARPEPVRTRPGAQTRYQSVGARSAVEPPHGLESTILGLDGTPALLRPGGLPAEALEACLGAPLAAGGDSERPSSPGQLASHYAPEAALRMNADAPRPGEAYLGFGPGATGEPRARQTQRTESERGEHTLTPVTARDRTTDKRTDVACMTHKDRAPLPSHRATR